MSATQWHPFRRQCPNNHWETIIETGISERLKRSETPLSNQFSKPRKAFETTPVWSHWSFARLAKWGRTWLKRRCSIERLHWKHGNKAFWNAVALEPLFCKEHFKHFKHFNLKCSLTWRFRSCSYRSRFEHTDWTKVLKIPHSKLHQHEFFAWTSVFIFHLVSRSATNNPRGPSRGTTGRLRTSAFAITISTFTVAHLLGLLMLSILAVCM